MVLGILLMGDPDSHDPDQSFIPAVGYLVDLIENTKESVREKAHTHLLGLVEVGFILYYQLKFWMCHI